jgi:hypothetical protein
MARFNQKTEPESEMSHLPKLFYIEKKLYKMVKACERFTSITIWKPDKLVIAIWNPG